MPDEIQIPEPDVVTETRLICPVSTCRWACRDTQRDAYDQHWLTFHRTARNDGEPSDG